MKVRIGTRRSTLALWQARLVSKKLSEAGIESELVEIESFGDKEQDLPIHKLGDKGVFTKALDDALLKGEIDAAVHSLKDVPTELIDELTLAAVLERANPADVLVRPKSLRPGNGSRTIATGSIRRNALWLNKFPDDEVVGLRGNVPTRIQKIDQSNYYGGIFAFAGLERIGLKNRVTEVLDWMLPAPAQGAIGIVAAKKNEKVLEILRPIEHSPSRICVDIERGFMNELEAGCSSPVAALAQIEGDKLHFKGAVLSIGGSQRLDIERTIPAEKAGLENGKTWARELKAEGADEILRQVRENE